MTQKLIVLCAAGHFIGATALAQQSRTHAQPGPRQLQAAQWWTPAPTKSRKIAYWRAPQQRSRTVGAESTARRGQMNPAETKFRHAGIAANRPPACPPANKTLCSSSTHK